MGNLGRAAASALRVYDLLRDRILISSTRVTETLDLTWPTVQTAIRHLEKLGIAREVTGKRRDRVCAYERQLEVLDEGTGIFSLWPVNSVLPPESPL